MSDAMTKKTRLLEHPLFHLVTLVVIALFAYSNTFQVPFLLDDEGSIQLNSAVHGLGNFFNGGYSLLPNRVIGYLSFAINYHFGELNVTGYHIVNLGIHIICAFLVYCLVRVTFRTPNLNKSFREQQSNMFAFIIALLFVSHPIQTQAVTYIVQRLTSLTTLFYLAALVCYIQWRLTKRGTDPFLKIFTSPWYVLSFVVTLLAMKTKEIAFTLPIIILLYEYSFFGRPGRKQLAQMTPFFLTMAIIPYTIYSTITPLIQSGGTLLSDVNSPELTIARITRWEYLYTQFSVILSYLRLLLLPVNQNLDYDYPINHALFAPRTLFSLLALLAILTLGAYLFVKSKHQTEQTTDDIVSRSSALKSQSLCLLAAFGIFWFFITLSVESSIISLRDVIFEHRLYLPSFGFFLTAVSCGALCVIWLKQYFKDIQNITIVLMAGIILTLSGATHARNNVWQNWISIWSDTVSRSPGKPRAHNVLGIGYYYSLKFDEALREYQEAVRLKPDYIEAYYNMGLALKEKKQYAESLNMFLKVLSISAFNADQYAKAYNEIGINYAEMGEPDQAVKAFASSVKFDPESIEYRNNYAFALKVKGNLDDALREFQTVVQLDPRNDYAINAVTEIKFEIVKSREKQQHIKLK